MIYEFYSKKKFYDSILITVIFKIVVFFLIGFGIFNILQIIIVPKRYSYNNTYDIGKLASFYKEERNEIDILIEGTSHSAGGILPMELYENYGIKSYNLATAIQPIEVSYYMACEALKTQNPKVLVLDVSNLYLSGVTEFYWRIVLDEMQYGKNKVNFIEEYTRQFLDKDKLVSEIKFPLLYYHDNWKSLSQQDFNHDIYNKQSFGKGGIMISTIAQAWMSVEYMNEITDRLIQDNEQFVYMYNGEEVLESYNESVLYSADIPDKNFIWFKKLHELCEANGVTLLAVKVPSMSVPQSYGSAWTRKKYIKVKNLCEELGIAYFDMMYEADAEIDWGKDTWDGGPHLNLNGARKISAALGNYLIEAYELSIGRSEQWDKDLVLYQEERNVALLELEQDFVTYIDKLINEYNNKMIFIAASEDMSNGLSDMDINILRLLGLRMDYSQAFDNSYIAVIENGNVLYEALSNRPLNYEGVYGLMNKTYEVYSSGWNTNSRASIKLDDKEYAVNSRGLNIVVYDAERDLVLDSVCFDTYAEQHMSVRNYDMVNDFRQEFEQYLMEVEDK